MAMSPRPKSEAQLKYEAKQKKEKTLVAKIARSWHRFYDLFIMDNARRPYTISIGVPLLFATIGGCVYGSVVIAPQKAHEYVMQRYVHSLNRVEDLLRAGELAQAQRELDPLVDKLRGTRDPEYSAILQFATDYQAMIPKEK